MGQRRVVITGMGAISPAGVGVDALWSAVRDGKPCGGLITKFNTDRNLSKIAASIPSAEMDLLGNNGSASESRDPALVYAMTAGQEAILQAGLDDVDKQRCGVCLGTAIGGVEKMESTFNELVMEDPEAEEAPRYPQLKNTAVPPSLYWDYSGNTPSIELAAQFGLCGPVTCISTGCTAGVDAIGHCLDLIRLGEADVMISGGLDAPITPICLSAFDVICALSRRNGEPNHASRPFDEGRDGFLLSEGAGIVVLEEYEHAKKRGAVILGELLGYGTNCNAFHMTSMHENGEMLAVSIRLALEDAELRPSQIDYINAHGSSTPQNDRAETAAYKEVFGADAMRIPISSTKSVTGHPLGAASALELIVSVLAVRESWVPPTANLSEPSEQCDLDYVPRLGRSQAVTKVLSNASGFGGLHSALIVGEVTP